MYMDNTATAITTYKGAWREAIRLTLVQRAGDAPDGSAAAEAVISTWRQLVDLLTPVIGARGVDVIFRRSLYLTGKTFPWLASDEEQVESAPLLARLKACLAGRNPDDAAEAGYTLLATFIELLTTLIGESLTERLLSPLWAVPSPLTEGEIRS